MQTINSGFSMTKKTNTLSIDSIAKFLSTTELFKNIPLPILKEIALSFQIIHLAGDEILFHEKDHGDSLYVVMYGYLQATHLLDNGQNTIIGELGSGSVIGEIACLIDIPRTATICAVRDSILLKMNRDTFDSLLQKHPHAIMGITRQCINRLVAPKQSPLSITYFTLIPAGSFSNLINFSHIFVEKLSKYGNTLLLTEEIFDEIHGKGAAQTPLDSAKSTEIISWLHEQESKYRFIVYVTKELSAWSERCLRQADKIFLIGQLNESPQLNNLEQLAFIKKSNISSNIELVLLTDKSIKFASGVKNWLLNRPVVQHYNIRLNKENDLNRFIRLITGNALGLVLAGGGATAIGHMGVIRVLEELNIPIDYIAGTSMGAMIGATLALEMDYQSIINLMDYVFNKFCSNLDYTLPVSSLLKARVLGSLMREAYGEDTLIEELWQKFFCTSTNISCNELHIHEESLLWRAVRSSCSLPAILPPLHDQNNHIHVDGGILNNMPVDIMQERINRGKILASSLKINPKISTIKFEEDTASGWYLFVKHILLPKFKRNRMEQTKDFVSIATVIHDSMILGSDKHQKAMIERADYNIILDIDDFGLLNFKAMREIIDIGYQQAENILQENDLVKQHAAK